MGCYAYECESFSQEIIANGKLANGVASLYNAIIIDYRKNILEIILVMGYKLLSQISMQALAHKKYSYSININFYSLPSNARTWGVKRKNRIKFSEFSIRS